MLPSLFPLSAPPKPPYNEHETLFLRTERHNSHEEHPSRFPKATHRPSCCRSPPAWRRYRLLLWRMGTRRWRSRRCQQARLRLWHGALRKQPPSPWHHIREELHRAVLPQTKRRSCSRSPRMTSQAQRSSTTKATSSTSPITRERRCSAAPPAGVKDSKPWAKTS